MATYLCLLALVFDAPPLLRAHLYIPLRITTALLSCVSSACWLPESLKCRVNSRWLIHPIFSLLSSGTLLVIPRRDHAVFTSFTFSPRSFSAVGHGCADPTAKTNFQSREDQEPQLQGPQWTKGTGQGIQEIQHAHPAGAVGHSEGTRSRQGRC